MVCKSALPKYNVIRSRKYFFNNKQNKKPGLEKPGHI